MPQSTKPLNFVPVNKHYLKETLVPTGPRLQSIQHIIDEGPLYPSTTEQFTAKSHSRVSSSVQFFKPHEENPLEFKMITVGE